MKVYRMTETSRLREIVEIIEAADRRRAVAGHKYTSEEITEKELDRIYEMATGHELNRRQS